MLLDILPEIFRNLSLKALLQFRQVCRAWRHVINRDIPKVLCLYVRGTYAPDVWVIDCEPIDPRSVLTVHSLGVLADPNFIRTFKNLKRLMIKCRSNEILTHLSELDKLEHLELYEVDVGKDFELNLKNLRNLKKLFLRNTQCFYNTNFDSIERKLPPSLETFGHYDSPFPSAFEGLENLKVLISRYYSQQFLQLVNLERLHLTYLIEEDDKPRVFIGRLPKLLLLDIFYIDSEEHMNELLEEVDRLKPARNVKFYHYGMDSSVYVNEKRQNPEKEVLTDLIAAGGYIDLKRVLSVVHQKPDLVLPFFYFQHTFAFWDHRELSMSRPFSFAALKNFSKNINKIVIQEPLSYDEVRNLLVNFRHILVFSINCQELDQQSERFFNDLPGILENLVSLTISTRGNGEAPRIFENLNFLNGFKHLLGFAAKFRENEENRKIILTIEERKKNMRYPILAEALNRGHVIQLDCQNFLR